MKETNSSNSKIYGVIRVIDEIAFQTNLLALNAAVQIQTAGASDTGTGLARLADEVRNLAHGSAQAARDTAALIEESMPLGGNRGLGPVAANHEESEEANQELAAQTRRLYAVVERVRCLAGNDKILHNAPGEVWNSAVEHRLATLPKASLQAPVLARISWGAAFPLGDQK